MTSTLHDLETRARQKQTARRAYAWAAIGGFILFLWGAKAFAQTATGGTLPKGKSITVVGRTDTVTKTVTIHDTVRVTTTIVKHDTVFVPVSPVPVPPVPVPPTPDTTPTPPAPDPTSHEPAGFTVLRERGFSTLDSAGWNNLWVSHLAILNDATAPRSPSAYAQILNAAGTGGGGSPATIRSTEWGKMNHIYLSLWFRISSNWVPHPSGVDKLAYLWSQAPSGGDQHSTIYLTAQHNSGNCLTPEVHDQYGETANYQPNLAPGACIALGVRHRWELVIDANQGSGGAFSWWLDGVAMGKYSGLKFAPGEVFVFGEIDPVYGGGSDGGNHPDMSMDFDHIRISGKP